jgi:hypothetical protein
VNLSPAAAWLLVRGAEGEPLDDLVAVAADRDIDMAFLSAQLSVLEERELVVSGALTGDGRVLADRLLEARCSCLHSLVADWEPDADPRVNDAIDRLARSLARETPPVAAAAAAGGDDDARGAPAAAA